MLIMSMGQVVTWGISLLYLVLISRYLGPGRFGELTLAKSIVMVLWLGAKLGMDTLITRSVARRPERAGVLVSAAMMARTALAFPVLAALFMYAHLAHLNAATSLAAYVYAAAEMVWAPQMLLVATFQGREHMSLSTLWTIGQNVLGLGLAVAIMWWRGGVAAFAAADLPVALVLLGLTLYWMRRFAQLTWRVSLRDLREVIVGGLAFWATDVFFTIYLYIDTVILAALVDNRAVGFYAPATRMFSVALFPTSIIGAATLPLLSRLGRDPGADFKRAGRKTLALFILCAVPLTIGLATFAGPLILTVFGPAYRPSVPVLVALSLCIVPMFLNFQFNQLLTARDQQWRWTVAMAMACVVNPPLNLVLIPLAQHTWHNGALGAAVAWLATEILQLIYGTTILRDVVLDRHLGRVAMGALVAGVAQAGVLWLTGALWPPIGEALGVAAYGAAVVALGALPYDDVVLLWETITRRGRRADPRAILVESSTQG
jgi:O-antigen/teichoic acid export membrane protein